MSDESRYHEEVPIHLRRKADEIRQCGRPTGEIGIKVAQEMNEHHARLWQWGLDHIELPQDASAAILDVGCGSGMLLRTVGGQCAAGRLCGLDHSGDMVALSRETCQELCDAGRAEFVTGSVSELPFDDAVFDLVTAFETIYFWPDIEADLREVHRVLRPGGTFLAVVESYDSPEFAERNQFCMELSGGQVFTPEAFATLVESAGFQSIQVDTIEEKNWMTLVAQK